jgi:hypothetical protein
LEQPPVLRLTSISRVPPDLQPQDIPTPPASEWRLKATLSPPPSELYRPDIGGMSECDYSNKYYITSGETQFTVQREEAGRLSGASGYEQWRIMERVQKYGCTDVQPYRSTVVQPYSCTAVQTNIAIERMLAVGFRKRDPSLNY